jgi:hypothetical protein
MTITDVMNARAHAANTRHIELWDYDPATGLMLYHAIGPRGALTSQSVWLIEKFTFALFSGQQMPTSAKLSADNSVWDNRATSVTYS